MHNIILSYIISKYTINHIKSSNIIKWLTVIQSKRKKEGITKRKRKKERKKERKKVSKKEREIRRE